MPTGWEQQAGSGIRKGISCVQLDMIHKEACQNFLQDWPYVCWWWWWWFIPSDSSGAPDSKPCTFRSPLYMLKSVSVMGFGFFCPFVWTTIDCSQSLLVLLLSPWSIMSNCCATGCMVVALRQWYRATFPGQVILFMFQVLRSCVGMCFSDPIWPMLCVTPHVCLLWHCKWVLTLLCERFLSSPKNYHNQCHLGIFILYNARGIQNACSALLASSHSSRCFSFWRFIDSYPLSFSSSGPSVRWNQ